MAEQEEHSLRVEDHPVLGETRRGKRIWLVVDGEPLEAFEGEPIASALMAAGRRTLRHTTKRGEPRGVFCALGRCTDCVMTVDGQPNVRTCVTLVRDGMVVETQEGLGDWSNGEQQSESRDG